MVPVRSGFEITALAQHRDAFVAQHAALAHYRTTHRGNPVTFWFVLHA